MGLLAIDIDGTLTHEAHRVSPEVIEALERFASEGWKLYFITGRNFSWAMRVLSHLKVPFYLAVLNGALILEMPASNIVRKNFLSKDDLMTLDGILANEHHDYLLYGIHEGQDRVYHRKQASAYMQQRARHLNENWFHIEDFAKLPFNDFPTIKWIGEKARLEAIADLVVESYGWYVPVIRDPVNPDYFIAQASNPKANKGHALDLFAHHRPVIAAGDDLNDLPMLLLADVKVVMQDAPPALKDIADIVAPSVYQDGLIEGLTQAMQRLKP
jgi:Cof subfamily protein (haloacid dehalogenase superfamily)